MNLYVSLKKKTVEDLVVFMAWLIVGLKRHMTQLGDGNEVFQLQRVERVIDSSYDKKKFSRLPL